MDEPPKFTNGEIDGGWIELSLTSCEFLEFTWEKIVAGESCNQSLARSQDLPQRKVEGCFFIWGVGVDILLFNKAHQDVVFHTLFDLAPGKPKLGLLGLPLRHIAYIETPTFCALVLGQGQRQLC